MHVFDLHLCFFVFLNNPFVLLSLSLSLSLSLLDNFQPESVDKSRPGGLVGNGETFELEFSGSGGTTSNNNTDPTNHGHTVNGGGGGETFSWTSTERPGRQIDCLMIFDEETQVSCCHRE